VLTGNASFAITAITILDTYSGNLKAYTNSNAPLQAAWGASKWPRAAELIRANAVGPDVRACSALLARAVDLSCFFKEP
jgi:hypothetical protein